MSSIWVLTHLSCVFLKWNEQGFSPPLCTYKLNWARRTSWGWGDEWDDTALQTQVSKFKAWRSEAEHATYRTRMIPTILSFTSEWGRNIFVFFQTAETGKRTPNSCVKGSGDNHYPRATARLSDATQGDRNYFEFLKWSLLLLKYHWSKHVYYLNKCYLPLSLLAPPPPGIINRSNP